MNTKSAETLIRLYFEGKTSLKEEQQLKTYFEQEDLPEELKALKPIFSLADNKEEVFDDAFDKKVLAQIKDTPKSGKRITAHFLFWPMAAASLALLIFVSGLFNLNNTSHFEDTYNDPAQAYAQAAQALQFVGIKLSGAMEPAHKAGGQLEKGMDQVNKLQKLYTGIEQTRKIGLIDQTLNNIPIQ
ncbi:MAG: hypothetical protein K8F24_11275 [Bacteroidales bacterium]|nr:hypothetical protein [Bacteroidales bacterium]